MKQISTFVLIIGSLLLSAFTGPIPAVSASATSISLASTTLTTSPSTATYSSYTPRDSDSYLRQDKVYLDLGKSSLLFGKGYPMPVSLVLNGFLPDPCHQLRVAIKPADAFGKITLSVYSVFDPKQICISVLQPFSATVSLGSFNAGTYTVYINGMFFSKFTIKEPSFTLS